MTKICSKCKQEKELSCFTKNKKSKDKLSYRCKECDRSYYLKDKDKKLAHSAKYRKEHREKYKQYLRNYYKTNKKEMNAKGKEWRETHKSEIIAYRKNPEKIVRARKVHKLYVQRNPDKIFRWKQTSAKRHPRNEWRTLEYIQWAYEVKARDKFTCRNCEKKGNSLNSHHIFPWADFSEFRYEINNGICLCYKCHKKFHDIHGKSKFLNPWMAPA